jgi:hypothetical protein
MHGLLAWQQPRITLITAIQITQVQTASRTMIVVAMIKHTTRTTMDSIEATTIMYKAMVMIKMITIEHNEPKLGCITTVVTVAPPTVAAVWYNGYSHTLHLSLSLSLSLARQTALKCADNIVCYVCKPEKNEIRHKLLWNNCSSRFHELLCACLSLTDSSASC